MRKLKYLFFLLLFLSQQARAEGYQKTDLGVIATTQSVRLEIQFFSPEIVRVLKTPEGASVENKSLSVVRDATKQDLKISNDGDNVTIESSALRVILNLTTGKIAYQTVNGELLLTEKDYGIQFTSVKDVNKATFLARQAFMLEKGEAIYGLGQQQNGKLKQNGQKVILKNDNMKICFPLVQSIKGYGIFWDNYSATTFVENPQEMSYESLGDCADYYFMYGGNAEGVVAKIRELTGQSPMLPLWGYGYLQSRERYKNQDELTEVVEKYRNLKIPLDGIIQDWQYWGRDSVWNSMSFDQKTFPNPKAMVDKVHSLNAHLMIVAWPGFGPLTKQYAEFKEKKMLINFDTWPPKSGVKPYDPYNPTARAIYWDYLNKGVFSFNTDGWWLDSSEPDHINVKEADFDQPTYLGSYRSVVNAFPLVHIKGVYEHQRATTSDKRVFILTRSAFVGQQRFGANSWSGDVSSDWGVLTRQIPAALNFSLSGVPYWNADIGGFFAGAFVKDGGAKNPAFQELYVRWMQFATFTPMMRSHGTDIPREIYQFGVKGQWAYDAQEKYINLRYQLLPYLYSTAWNVSNRSGSIMRALIMDFASDKNVLDKGNEYMYGKSILVAPVTTSMYTNKKEAKVVEDFTTVKTQKVYLPQGTEWFDFWTGAKLPGGQEIVKETPVDVIPLYVRAGTILPIAPKVQFAAEKRWDNLEIRIYTGADGEFVLYEDENDNYNYEKGAFSTITFKWNDKSRELSIYEPKGSFTGMLKNRTFNIVVVNKANGLGNIPSEKFNKKIKYSGKTVVTKL